MCPAPRKHAACHASGCHTPRRNGKAQSHNSASRSGLFVLPSMPPDHRTEILKEGARQAQPVTLLRHLPNRVLPQLHLQASLSHPQAIRAQLRARPVAAQDRHDFGKRVSRRMHGKLATVIDQIEHGHHVFRAYFKSGFLKQYEKFLTFLRNELVSNNLADFGLKKGLDHLDAVRTTFQLITDRFAGFQAERGRKPKGDVAGAEAQRKTSTPAPREPGHVRSRPKRNRKGYRPIRSQPPTADTPILKGPHCERSWRCGCTAAKVMSPRQMRRPRRRLRNSGVLADMSPHTSAAVIERHRRKTNHQSHLSSSGLRG